jgi:hypothetical protein
MITTSSLSSDFTTGTLGSWRSFLSNSKEWNILNILLWENNTAEPNFKNIIQKYSL